MLHSSKHFNMIAINVDQEFDKDEFKDALLDRGGIHLNAASTKEHVGDIEQHVRTLKARLRRQWQLAWSQK